MDSWSRERRMIGKAAHLPQGSSPRFVVTSMSAERIEARPPYEAVYCARGHIENRLMQFGDRT